MEKQTFAVTIFLIIFVALLGGIGAYGMINHLSSKNAVAVTQPTPQIMKTTPIINTPEPTPAETPSPSATPSPSPANNVTIQDDQNKGTVDAKVGQQVELNLSSTYWQLRGKNGLADPAILSLADSNPQAAPPGTCVPGGGCGSFTATFNAVSKGVTQIEATRTTCGEALKCTVAESKFFVTVVIK